MDCSLSTAKQLVFCGMLLAMAFAWAMAMNLKSITIKAPLVLLLRIPHIRVLPNEVAMTSTWVAPLLVLIFWL